MSEQRDNKVIELLNAGIISYDDAWSLIELMDYNLYYNLSQEEIDAIANELKELYERPVTIKVDPFGQIDCTGSEVVKPKSNCVFHEWVWYTGLNETFEHCKKCGEKKL